MTVRRICQMCWFHKFESDGSLEDKFCPSCKRKMGVTQSGGTDPTGRPTPTGPKKTVSEIVRSRPLDIDWEQLQ